MTRSSSLQRKSAIKLMHRLWATNHELNKRDKAHNPRCSRCQHPNEDFFHLFRCPSATATQHSTTHTLREFLQSSHIAPIMTTVIIHDLTNWYQANPTVFPFTDYPPDSFLTLLQQASTAQSTIGWHNFLRGRLANKWYEAHDVYHKERNLHSAYSSTTIAPNLVLQLWDISRQFWYQRNEAVHGISPQDIREKQSALLKQKLREAYSTHDQFNPQDQQILFSLPLEERLSTTLKAQLHWYALYQHCLTAPPEPTDTPPPPTTTLHNFFRRFIPQYFPSHTSTTHRNTLSQTVNNPLQQPANPTP